MTCAFLTQLEGFCWCGEKLTGRQRRYCSRTCARAVTNNHRWTNAKHTAKTLATWFQCAACNGFFRQVEVNHIVPCKGKHGAWGCWHHATNLEVLCKPCHKIKTNEQRKNGWT